MPVINISCYKFIALTELVAFRNELITCCKALDLVGTILLAPEGINLFLAGNRAAITDFFIHLQADPRFADLQPKESVSSAAPFKRLRIRLKKEIITMKLPLVRPEVNRAPTVSAATLKRWLDQGYDDTGRAVLMLDTRNDYEIAEGGFKGAINYKIVRFSDFPAQLKATRAVLSGKTIVAYCTGGIRCEKAALHMQDLGISNVYQLEGGILKYFEQVGNAHYQGQCFVFDARGTLDTDLHPAQEPLEASSARG